MDDTFVIGDVHGHLDRLEALLKKAGLLDRCEACNGSGIDIVQSSRGPLETDAIDCYRCHGDGWARRYGEVTVVQLGDLGHFGQTGSPTADMLCYRFGQHWLDIVLWGNHDRAVVDSSHTFMGYFPPDPATKNIMTQMRHDGQLRVAHAVEGYLLTHAGLHAAFKHQKIDLDKENPYEIAEWLNLEDAKFLDSVGADPQTIAIVGAIGRRRGGRAVAGGILWRDAGESLYDAFPQVFGHSAGDKVRHYQSSKHDGWCIDIGSSDNGRLAGMWLPSREVVEIP